MSLPTEVATQQSSALIEHFVSDIGACLTRFEREFKRAGAVLHSAVLAETTSSPAAEEAAARNELLRSVRARVYMALAGLRSKKDPTETLQEVIASIDDAIAWKEQSWPVLYVVRDQEGT
jgi:hypothetical protein